MSTNPLSQLQSFPWWREKRKNSKWNFTWKNKTKKKLVDDTIELVGDIHYPIFPSWRNRGGQISFLLATHETLFFWRKIPLVSSIFFVFWSLGWIATVLCSQVQFFSMMADVISPFFRRVKNNLGFTMPFFSSTFVFIYSLSLTRFLFILNVCLVDDCASVQHTRTYVNDLNHHSIYK